MGWSLSKRKNVVFQVERIIPDIFVVRDLKSVAAVKSFVPKSSKTGHKRTFATIAKFIIFTSSIMECDPRIDDITRYVHCNAVVIDGTHFWIRVFSIQKLEVRCVI